MKLYFIVLLRGSLFLAMLSSQAARCQDSTSLSQQAIGLPDKVFGQVEQKSQWITRLLDKQMNKYLEKMARHEEKMKRKLAKKDPAAAARIFGSTTNQYATAPAAIAADSTLTKGARNKYIPHLDSLTTAFKFAQKLNGATVLGAASSSAAIQSAVDKMKGMQSHFTQAEEIKKRLSQRQDYLKEQLSRYGMGKELTKYKEQLYYYQSQVKEYQHLFEDPSKIEASAMAIVQKTALFKDFFQKNSQLASLFRLPGTSAEAAPLASLQGLQARADVEQNLFERYGTRQISQQIQPQLQSARSAISQLKEKAGKLEGGKGDVDMPGFTPNDQKTKRLLDRLEYGFNFQSAKTNSFFPATSDLGLSVGYKLNDKSVVGIGSSYKMGWGRDIRHISVSHEGVGLRSFADYKLKGSFWISGGAELNYKSAFRKLDALSNLSGWQQSALLGISKKYKITSKMNGNLQLLYDFLHSRQTPVTQPVVFRLGYTL